MHEQSFEEALEQILAKDPRFQRDAYHFLREALDYTQKSIAGNSRDGLRHVTGQELLGGIRDYARAQFGPMAMMLFEEWGVRSCGDFGEIVFNMVENGLLAKTDKDSREDFKDGYDFFEAFRQPYLPANKQSRSHPAPASFRN